MSVGVLSQSSRASSSGVSSLAPIPQQPLGRAESVLGNGVQQLPFCLGCQVQSLAERHEIAINGPPNEATFYAFRNGVTSHGW